MHTEIGFHVLHYICWLIIWLQCEFFANLSSNKSGRCILMAGMGNTVIFMLCLRIVNTINRTLTNCTRVDMHITVRFLAFNFISSVRGAKCQELETVCDSEGRESVFQQRDGSECFPDAENMSGV